MANQLRCQSIGHYNNNNELEVNPLYRYLNAENLFNLIYWAIFNLDLPQKEISSEVKTNDDLYMPCTIYWMHQNLSTIIF